MCVCVCVCVCVRAHGGGHLLESPQNTECQLHTLRGRPLVSGFSTGRSTIGMPSINGVSTVDRKPGASTDLGVYTAWRSGI